MAGIRDDEPPSPPPPSSCRRPSPAHLPMHSGNREARRAIPLVRDGRPRARASRLTSRTAMPRSHWHSDHAQEHANPEQSDRNACVSTRRPCSHIACSGSDTFRNVSSSGLTPARSSRDPRRVDSPGCGPEPAHRGNARSGHEHDDTTTFERRSQVTHHRHPGRIRPASRTVPDRGSDRARSRAAGRRRCRTGRSAGCRRR